MDDSVKMILKKLDDIDGRLRNLESPNPTNPTETVGKVDKMKRDPLFAKALEIMDKYDEISSKMLADALKIDEKRTETIMDQMEAAGIGTCYTKEV